MNKERIKAAISLLERMKAENPISNKDGSEICGVYWEVVQNDLERECHAQSSRTKDGSIYILNPGYIDAYENLQLYSARHSMATIAANDAGIDRWTVNLMLNHTDQSMRVTELYIKRDFTPINEANDRLMKFIFGL